MRHTSKIVPLALVVAAAAATPAAAAPAAGAAVLRQFEGTVVSVNRDARSFRLHDSERGTVRIRVTRRTRFERIAGLGALEPRDAERRGDGAALRRPLARARGRALRRRRRPRRRRRLSAATPRSAGRGAQNVEFRASQPAPLDVLRQIARNTSHSGACRRWRSTLCAAGRGRRRSDRRDGRPNATFSGYTATNVARHRPGERDATFCGHARTPRRGVLNR